MPKFMVGREEWYPVYIFYRPAKESDEGDRDCVEVSLEEVEELKALQKKLEKWQKKIMERVDGRGPISYELINEEWDE